MSPALKEGAEPKPLLSGRENSPAAKNRAVNVRATKTVLLSKISRRRREEEEEEEEFFNLYKNDLERRAFRL